MIKVAIIGAGPYGLSIAAHLQHRGCSYRVFGQPMQTWLAMPEGINLKSRASSTNLSVPQRGFDYTKWCRDRQLEDFEPCAMASFAAYGLWVREQLVANVEPSNVVGLKRGSDGTFRLTLENGAAVLAENVVIATGLSYFEHIPAVLSSLPGELVSHTAHHHSYEGFRGRHVAVIGSGASATEASAMIHEAGGYPIQLVRDGKVNIYDGGKRHRSLLAKLKSPDSSIGPGWKATLIAHLPAFAHLVPQARIIRLYQRTFGASAPWWIKDRFVGIVPTRLNCTVTGSEPDGARVRLKLSDKGGAICELTVDHVLAGTGYEVDIDKIPFLDTTLAAMLARTLRGPKLSRRFESSVRGLYFAGPVAGATFGPVLRFVAGAGFAAKTISKHIARRSRTLHPFRIKLGNQLPS